MNVNANAATAPDVRLQIIDAAERRFQQYGYGKTTMMEIASDVDMSAANLYRYFNNKDDIAAACCDRCMSGRVDILRRTAREQGRSAGERLLYFVLEDLNYTHQLVSDNPRISEMVEDITARHPDMVQEKVQSIVTLLAEVLAYGNETGEFDVENIIDTARHIHSSLVLFEVPIFVGMYPKSYYESTARGLVELLIRGLAHH